MCMCLVILKRGLGVSKSSVHRGKDRLQKAAETEPQGVLTPGESHSLLAFVWTFFILLYFFIFYLVWFKTKAYVPTLLNHWVKMIGAILHCEDTDGFLTALLVRYFQLTCT